MCIRRAGVDLHRIARPLSDVPFERELAMVMLPYKISFTSFA